MALADYFQRSAVAAAQVVSGYDEDAIRRRLEGVTVAIGYSAEAAKAPEGRLCIEMAVRILARLYPTIRIEGPDSEAWVDLARAINPKIDFVDDDCDFSLCVGSGAPAGSTAFYLGSDGWDALFSTREGQPLGQSRNPLGPGVAACFGAAAIFRAVFFEEVVDDDDLVFSTLRLAPCESEEPGELEDLEIPASTVLVGLGAVGNAVLWALGRAGSAGSIQLVDPEPIEASNLQRYVMAVAEDEGRSKADLAAETLAPGLGVVAHSQSWAEFVSDAGSRWERVLVALDSAHHRRAVQASLPRWIANAWTQPGDLGVSVHPWEEGACLACLYLPQDGAPNEDQLVASAMGFDDEHHLRQVRSLLVTDAPPPPELLQEAAAALEVDPEPLMQYRDRPLRDLYVEGICGGAAVPLDRVGLPERSVHVPLAHQSAMAGLLLAGRLYADLLRIGPEAASATRIDVMRPLGGDVTRPVAKDPRGICICQDPVYEAAYQAKWRSGPLPEPPA